jgi:uncharacterized protein YodC (DUF2158 family)
MASSYNVGDAVKLKTGGPDMSISKIFAPNPTIGRTGVEYRCQWFAGKKLESGDFPPESLELVGKEAK